MSNNECRIPDKPRSGTFGPMSDKTKVTVKLGVLFGTIGTLFGAVVTISIVSFTLGGERSNALNKIDSIATQVSKLVSGLESQERRLRQVEDNFLSSSSNLRRVDALESRFNEDDRSARAWRESVNDRLARIEVAVGAAPPRSGKNGVQP